MPEQITKTDDKARQTLAKMTETYLDKGFLSTMNCLLLGSAGSGKTWSAQTAVKPVLIHSFDPGGPRGLKPWIEKGEIFVEDFSLKDPSNPNEWNNWCRRLVELEQSGVFNTIGTFMIDSLTTWVEAGMAELSRTRWTKPNEIQDYNVMNLMIKHRVKQINSLPCNTIFTAHIEREVEQATGKVDVTVATYKSMKPYIPTLFDEIYIAEVSMGKNGPKWMFRTKPDGIYKCRTRIGAQVFNEFEEPDFKKLLEKAGYPYKDKGEV